MNGSVTQTKQREINNFKVFLAVYKHLILSTTGTISFLWSCTSKLTASQNFQHVTIAYMKRNNNDNKNKNSWAEGK